MIGAVSGASAGYLAGGWPGLVFGGIIGGGVGFVAAPASGTAAGYVVGMTGSRIAGIVAGTTAFTGVNGLAGAAGTVVTNATEGQPLSKGVGVGVLIGAASPLASGEAYIVGPGAALITGLPKLAASVLAAQTGIFNLLGAVALTGQPSK